MAKKILCVGLCICFLLSAFAGCKKNTPSLTEYEAVDTPAIEEPVEQNEPVKPASDKTDEIDETESEFVADNDDENEVLDIQEGSRIYDANGEELTEAITAYVSADEVKSWYGAYTKDGFIVDESRSDDYSIWYCGELKTGEQVHVCDIHDPQNEDVHFYGGTEFDFYDSNLDSAVERTQNLVGIFIGRAMTDEELSEIHSAVKATYEKHITANTMPVFPEGILVYANYQSEDDYWLIQIS